MNDKDKNKERETIHVDVVIIIVKWDGKKDEKKRILVPGRDLFCKML